MQYIIEDYIVSYALITVYVSQIHLSISHYYKYYYITHYYYSFHESMNSLHMYLMYLGSHKHSRFLLTFRFCDLLKPKAQKLHVTFSLNYFFSHKVSTLVSFENNPVLHMQKKKWYFFFYKQFSSNHKFSCIPQFLGFKTMKPEI